MDTGEAKIWKGKVVVIRLVTEAIEPEIEASSELGKDFFTINILQKK